MTPPTPVIFIVHDELVISPELVPAPVKAVVPPSGRVFGVTDVTVACAFVPQSEKVIASVDVCDAV